MEQEEIIEGNILIAILDGLYQNDKLNIIEGDFYHKDGFGMIPFVSKRVNRFSYNKTWKDMIPILIKITKEIEPKLMNRYINDGVDMAEFIDLKSKLDLAINELDLTLIFPAVVDFIKWYNQNKL
jgi:hypothetical protein